MIGFRDVKSITIPEGSVKKITAYGVTLWEKQSDLLPSKYQRVEYIEMTGDQGGLYNESILDVTEISFSFALSAFTDCYISGAYYGSSMKPFCANRLIGSHKMLYCYFNDNAKYIRSPALALNTKYEVSMSVDLQNLSAGMRILQNGAEINSSTISLDSYDVSNIRNFGIGCNGYWKQSGSQQGISGRIYSQQHKSNGVLVRDFIPCYLKEDSAVIGFYDTIKQTFFSI